MGVKGAIGGSGRRGWCVRRACARADPRRDATLDAAVEASQFKAIKARGGVLYPSVRFRLGRNLICTVGGGGGGGFHMLYFRGVRNEGCGLYVDDSGEG